MTGKVSLLCDLDDKKRRGGKERLRRACDRYKVDTMSIMKGTMKTMGPYLKGVVQQDLSRSQPLS